MYFKSVNTHLRYWQYLLFISTAAIASAGCSHHHNEQNLENEIIELKKNIEAIKPGLGEIMSTIHMHHAKLYFSSMAENWELSAYQLDEIKEGLDQATELHDQFVKVKSSLKNLKQMTNTSLDEVDSAIKSKSKIKFLSGFKHLTESCNQCHSAAGLSFIVVQTPSAQMFSNQKFFKSKE